jgi:hypothetical protein
VVQEKGEAGSTMEALRVQKDSKTVGRRREGKTGEYEETQAERKNEIYRHKQIIE